MRTGFYKTIDSAALYPIGKICYIYNPTQLGNKEYVRCVKITPIGFDVKIYKNWEITRNRYKYIGSVKYYIKLLR